MMKMYFHFGLGDMILFKGLSPETTWQMCLACFIIFLSSFMLEAMNHLIGVTCKCQLRETFGKLSGTSTSLNGRQHHHNAPAAADSTSSQRIMQTGATTPQMIEEQGSNRNLYRVCCQNDDHDRGNNYAKDLKLPLLHCSYSQSTSLLYHLLKALIYGLQVILSLSLMLVAMTYNGYLILSIAMGKLNRSVKCKEKSIDRYNLANEQ